MKHFKRGYRTRRGGGHKGLTLVKLLQAGRKSCLINDNLERIFLFYTLSISYKGYLQIISFVPETIKGTYNGFYRCNVR